MSTVDLAWGIQPLPLTLAYLLQRSYTRASLRENLGRLGLDATRI